jgi:hypothetical protein
LLFVPLIVFFEKILVASEIFLSYNVSCFVPSSRPAVILASSPVETEPHFYRLPRSQTPSASKLRRGGKSELFTLFAKRKEVKKVAGNARHRPCLIAFGTEFPMYNSQFSIND